MTTIVRNIAWSGEWSRLYTDPSHDHDTSSDAESSSITTLARSDDGDTVVLSQEAQQAINMDAGQGDGGLDAVAAIYTAAAAVINSTTSTDKEKIAAFGAAYSLGSLPLQGTLGPAQYDGTSYGGKFEILMGKFDDDIANSDFMKTFNDTMNYAVHNGNLADNASELQTAMFDVLLNTGGVADGTNSLSINLQATTTQSSTGKATTSYVFSYGIGQKTQAGTQTGWGLVDPMKAFSGVKAPHFSGKMTPYVQDDASASMEVSSDGKKKVSLSFEDPRAALDQELADALFGPSDPKSVKSDAANEKSQTQKNNTQKDDNNTVSATASPGSSVSIQV